MRILKSIAGPVALARELASAYGLNDVRCQLIKATMRDTYDVWSHEGRFVLSVYRNGARIRDQIAAEVEIIDQVHAASLRTAQVVKQSNGERLLTLRMPEGERIALLFHFLDGVLLDRNPQPELAYEFGQFVARLHSVFADLSLASHRPVIGLDQLLDEPLRAVMSVSGIEIERQQAEFLTDAAEVIRRHFMLSQLDSEPTSLIHNDLIPSNVLVSPSGEIGLIDFDLCGWSWPALDVATYLNEVAYWGAPAGVGERFLAGYEGIRSLDGWERQSLPFFQAARYIWALGVPAAMVNEWGSSYLNARMIENHIAAIHDSLEHH